MERLPKPDTTNMNADDAKEAIISWEENGRGRGTCKGIIIFMVDKWMVAVSSIIVLAKLVELQNSSSQ
jgi:hypothetical protein